MTAAPHRLGAYLSPRDTLATATDLAHGPVAALDPLFPVWAIASPDATLATVQEAAARGY